MRKGARPSDSSSVAASGSLGMRVLQVRLGVGPTWDGAGVIRLFWPRGRHALTLRDTAMVLGAAMSEGVSRSLRCGLIVLPAGAVTLATLQLAGVRWTDTDRVAVRAALFAWGASLGRLLPEDHPPVCVGVDAAVRFSDGLVAPYAVQSLVLVVRREAVSVTLKSKPVDAEERAFLPIAWDQEHARPQDRALAEQSPITEVHGQRALMLICHDAVTFAPRSVRSTRAGTWSDTIRRQYDTLLATQRPSLVLHAIHEMPGRAGARQMLVPIFQSAHASLRRDHGLTVIAVSGLQEEVALRAFDRMHTHLACDVQHLDLLIDIERPQKRRGSTRSGLLGDEFVLPENDDGDW